MKNIFLLNLLLLGILFSACGSPKEEVQTIDLGAATKSTDAPKVDSSDLEIPDFEYHEDALVVHPDLDVFEHYPESGPYYHDVMVLESSDGLDWEPVFDVPLIQHASVPAAMVLPGGQIVVYFVDFATMGEAGSSEELGCVISKDFGESFEWGGCELSGLTSEKAVDYSVVALSDGTYRMYYYASDKTVGGNDLHQIDSAISEDGIHFEREGTVFEFDGLVDPDVFYNGELWIMHVHSLKEGKTVVATSEDGQNFEFYGYLSPEDYGVTKPIELSDGTFRMYGFSQKGAQDFVYFSSEDGLSWTLEDTVYSVEGTLEITDPFVIEMDSRYLMFYKADPVSKILNSTEK